MTFMKKEDVWKVVLTSTPDSKNKFLQYKVMLIVSIKQNGWEKTVDDISQWASFLDKNEIDGLLTDYLTY